MSCGDNAVYEIVPVFRNTGSVRYSVYVDSYDAKCDDSRCEVRFSVEPIWKGVKLLFEASDSDGRVTVYDYFLYSCWQPYMFIWHVAVKGENVGNGDWRYFVDVKVFNEHIGEFVKLWSYEVRSENDYNDMARIGLAPMIARHGYTVKDVEEGFLLFLMFKEILVEEGAVYER